MADLICANTTFAEVKSKLAAAVSGDRVLIPAGTVTFTSCLSSQDPFSSGEDTTLQNKSIIIEGGYGGGETIFLDNCQKGNNIYPDRPQMIYWVTIASGYPVIKNITFQGGTTADLYNKGMVALLGSNPNFRITNCNWYPTETSGLQVYGSVYGVMDHCYTDNSEVNVCHYVFNGGDAGEGYGDTSFSQSFVPGTASMFFFENNTYENTQSAIETNWAIDGWNGSRFVFRHNTLINTTVGNHGTESSGRQHGQRAFEIYENEFDITAPSGWPSVIGLRGGTGLIYNNHLTQRAAALTGKFVSFINYRSDPFAAFYPFGWAGKFTPTSITRSGTTATVTCPNRFGLASNHGFNSTDHYVKIEGATDNLYNGIFRVTGVTATTFTYTMAGTPAADASGTLLVSSPWDGNTDAYGYRCMDQIGAGQADALSGDVPTPDASYNQALEPVFVWGQSVTNLSGGGASDAGVIVEGTNGPNHIVENRDYYLRAPQSGDAIYPYTAYTYPHPLNDGGGGGGGGTPATPTLVLVRTHK